MTKLLASIFSLTLLLVLSIAVMVHGWGLEVKSWGWVVLGYIGMCAITALPHLFDD